VDQLERAQKREANEVPNQDAMQELIATGNRLNAKVGQLSEKVTGMSDSVTGMSKTLQDQKQAFQGQKEALRAAAPHLSRKTNHPFETPGTKQSSTETKTPGTKQPSTEKKTPSTKQPSTKPSEQPSESESSPEEVYTDFKKRPKKQPPGGFQFQPSSGTGQPFSGFQFPQQQPSSSQHPFGGLFGGAQQPSGGFNFPAQQPSGVFRFSSNPSPPKAPNSGSAQPCRLFERDEESFETMKIAALGKGKDSDGKQQPPFVNADYGSIKEVLAAIEVEFPGSTLALMGYTVPISENDKQSETEVLDVLIFGIGVTSIPTCFHLSYNAQQGGAIDPIVFDMSDMGLEWRQGPPLQDFSSGSNFFYLAFKGDSLDQLNQFTPNFIHQHGLSHDTIPIKLATPLIPGHKPEWPVNEWKTALSLGNLLVKEAVYEFDGDRVSISANLSNLHAQSILEILEDDDNEDDWNLKKVQKLMRDALSRREKQVNLVRSMLGCSVKEAAEAKCVRCFPKSLPCSTQTLPRDLLNTVIYPTNVGFVDSRNTPFSVDFDIERRAVEMKDRIETWQCQCDEKFYRMDVESCSKCHCSRPDSSDGFGNSGAQGYSIDEIDKGYVVATEGHQIDSQEDANTTSNESRNGVQSSGFVAASDDGQFSDPHEKNVDTTSCDTHTVNSKKNVASNGFQNSIAGQKDVDTIKNDSQIVNSQKNVASDGNKVSIDGQAFESNGLTESDSKSSPAVDKRGRVQLEDSQRDKNEFDGNKEQMAASKMRPVQTSKSSHGTIDVNQNKDEGSGLLTSNASSEEDIKSQKSIAHDDQNREDESRNKNDGIGQGTAESSASLAELREEKKRDDPPELSEEDPYSAKCTEPRTERKAWVAKNGVMIQWSYVAIEVDGIKK
jgi:hypothetical protein